MSLTFMVFAVRVKGWKKLGDCKITKKGILQAPENKEKKRRIQV